jgi:hypothetical protein
MLSRLSRVLVVCLISCASCLAAPIQITIANSSGAPIKNALVILQQLQAKDHEFLRALTDERGNIPTQQLNAGLYRVIATVPYGQWQTGVREFLVRDQPVNLELRLAEGDSADTIAVSIGQLTVYVLDANGHPAVGARVLVRDADATPNSEHWGTTDAKGTTTLELTDTPALLVVVYHDQLYTFPTGLVDTERTLRLK